MILFSFLNNPEDRPGVFFYISTYSAILDGGDPIMQLGLLNGYDLHICTVLM